MKCTPCSLRAPSVSSPPRRSAALARRTPTDDPYPHLGRFDLLVVAPLTANTLARLAHGLADDVLTEAALAHPGPVLVAPAMNTRMWSHPATQANVATLRARGVELVGPVAGELAEGEEGIGRMAEPEEILARIEALLVDAGRPARRDSASSSPRAGRASRSMPCATSETAPPAAWAWRSRRKPNGAARTSRLLAANLAVAAPDGIDGRPDADRGRPRARGARTGRRRRRRHGRGGRRLPAVEPELPTSARRTASAWTVELEPTADVLAALGRRRAARGRCSSGSPRTTRHRGLERAREKRLAKNADLFVFNDVSRPDIGFDATDNEVVLLSNNGERTIEKAPKRVVAAAVLDEVERLLSTT